MVTIYFQDENEGYYLYKQLIKLLGNQKTSNRSAPVALHYTGENVLSIDLKPRDPVYEKIKPMILLFFAQHIIQTRENEWVLRCLKQNYYYTDEHEQHQILSIVLSLMEGNYHDIPIVKRFPSREDLVVASLDGFFSYEIMFSYESFLQFRLKPYHDLLRKYIECAIDEYKLEQDYQDFIHQLRQYVKKRASLFKTIHLFHQKKEYRLFNEHYYELTHKDIAQLFHGSEQPNNYPIASNLLKLLIGIAPIKIFLYTNSEDASMNLTIQNVFQERVCILPRHKFIWCERNGKSQSSRGLDFLG